MRNYKLLSLAFLALISSIIIYSCSKENVQETKSVSKNQLTVNRTTNNYPLSNYVIWQIKDKPYTVIFTSSGSNNHIWIVQNDVNFSSESTLQLTNVSLSFNTDGYLKLNYGTNVNVYSLANNLYQTYPANAVGLSKVIDDELLASLRTLSDTTKGGVIDDVNAKATCKKDGSSDKECKCSGGANSTSCECSKSIASVSWHEATSCKEGYFACCSGE
jgi:hypothetical protein